MKSIQFLSKGQLNWSNVEFDEKLDVFFDDCLFVCGDGTLFENTRFPEKGSVRFRKSLFSGKGKVSFNNAYFRSAIFEGGLLALKNIGGKPGDYDYDEAVKRRDAAIARLEILKAEPLPENSEVFMKGTPVDFTGVTTESAENLTFIQTYLGNAVFDGLTLRYVKLNIPEWRDVEDKILWWKNKRKALRLEMEVDKKNKDNPELRKLENQYTQLRANLEAQANYRDAGDFHYGEQKIRLIRKLDGWLVRFASWLYEILAGYGERPERAFFWLLVFIIFFSAVPSMFDPSLEFAYPFHWEGVKAWLPSYGKSMLELVTPFSWQKSLSSYEPRFLGVALFQLLLYVQTTIAFLALRRRFKR